MKTIPCPVCGSQNPRSYNHETGKCNNEYGCNRKRCERRYYDDKRRNVHEQCHATTGKRSIRWCTLTVGHEGPHLAGSVEWGGDFKHPLAEAFRGR